MKCFVCWNKDCLLRDEDDYRMTILSIVNVSHCNIAIHSLSIECWIGTNIISNIDTVYEVFNFC